MRDFRLCTLKTDGFILGENGHHIFSNGEVVSIQDDRIIIEYNLSIEGFNKIPEGYRKKLPDPVDDMINLLNMDYHSLIKNLKSCIEEYLQLSDYSCEIVSGICDRFFSISKELHPYLTMKSIDFMIEEVILRFNNNFWNEGNLDIDVTINLFEEYLYELKNVIYPLLSVILRDHDKCERYWENCRLTRYRELFSCRSISELKLVSFLERIENALEFLEAAIMFTIDYKDELLYLSVDKIMYQCINNILWESDRKHLRQSGLHSQLLKKYYEIKENYNGYNSVRKDIMELKWKTEENIKLQGEKKEKNEKVIKKISNHLKEKDEERTYEINSFEQLILIILKEHIRHIKKKDKWILKKCENCNKYFMAKRPNQIYCMNRSPQNPDRTCNEIGPSIKRNNSLSQFEKSYEKLLKRAQKKLKTAPSERYKEKLNKKISNWKKEKDLIERRLKKHELTEEEAVNQLEEKYNSIVEK